MTDAFHLGRFVTAQEGTYDQALGEIRAGRKRSHWMWFVFPQVAGLGSSPTAQHFAIHSADEAVAYWQHPVLGGRLRECLAAVLRHPERSAHEMFGTPDDLKLQSCATLFVLATGDPLCADVLQCLYGGEQCAATRRLLGLEG